MDENNKNKYTPPNETVKEPKRMPRSIFVWLVIIAGLVTLISCNDNSSNDSRVLTQSQFVKFLNDKQIINAELKDQGSDIYIIEGEYYPDKSKKTAHYQVKVVMTDELNTKMTDSINTKVADNNGALWKYILGSILPVIIVLALIYFIFMRQMRGGSRNAMDFGKSKARMIPPNELNVRFSDIAGADEAKEEIAEIVEYLRDPLRFQLVGGKIPKGCLLVGNPGTGKTLMAKAVACEAGVPFFSISGSDFVEMFVGVGASRVRDMFEQARKHTPCLIFIDEIDAVGRSRFSGWGGGHDEREQTLNAMLVEMDGLESRNGVIVLAATNRPDVLDPALLRPGRFDRQVVMDLPDIKGRRQILDVHVKKIKAAADLDLDTVARTTPGFSGADLANLCNEAALLAARRGLTEVTQAIMEEARDKVSYGTERRTRKVSEQERRLTAYHEAGHTLVALYNEYCVPVHKVTIIPRGQAYLGATFMMPKEDRYTRSKKEMQAAMAMAFGGRAAEELIFDDVTSGAAADIQQMTETARRMVCIFGMSDKLGAVKLGDYTNHPHLRIDGPPPEGISNETEREIDLEVREIINQACTEARECLAAHKDQLIKLSEELLVKETLSVDEIYTLLDIPRPETSAADSSDDSGEEIPVLYPAPDDTPAETAADNGETAETPAADGNSDE